MTAPDALKTPPAVTIRGEPPADGPGTFTSLFRPYAPRMALGFVWLALTNAAALTIPSLVNAAISVVEGRAKHGYSIWMVLVGLLVCAIAGAVTRVLSRVELFQVGRDVERSLRAKVFAHLSTLSSQFYRRQSTGDIMSRLTNDMTQIRLMAGFALLNALNTILLFSATLPILFSINSRVAWWALMPFPLVILTAQATTKIMFKRTKAQQEALSALSQRVQENLAGQQVVRAFSLEKRESERFKSTVFDLYTAAMRLGNVRLLMGPIVGFFGSMGIVLALFIGGQEIANDRMTIGDLVEMNTRIMMLMWPTIAMGFIISVAQRGRASLQRINAILIERPDVIDGHHRGQVTGHIVANNLHVAGTTTVKPNLSAPDNTAAPQKTAAAATTPPAALWGFSVNVKPGKVLGIVGRNGAGKSTFLRALSRQMPVARGEISVDGVDINDWALLSLMGPHGISVVPEDGFLFSATLKENIAFGKSNATDEEIARVIKLCDLERDIQALPEGLNTPVGERGVTLSGGQKQRVSLARALLVEPRVVLLDDCLSAVDAETEAHIVDALKAGLYHHHAITAVVVSHRLSATQSADEIVVCDHTDQGGTVVERGTHSMLLGKNGLYAQLWGKEQLQKALAS